MHYSVVFVLILLTYQEKLLSEPCMCEVSWYPPESLMDKESRIKKFNLYL